MISDVPLIRPPARSRPPPTTLPAPLTTVPTASLVGLSVLRLFDTSTHLNTECFL